MLFCDDTAFFSQFVEESGVPTWNRVDCPNLGNILFACNMPKCKKNVDL